MIVADVDRDDLLETDVDAPSDRKSFTIPTTKKKTGNESDEDLVRVVVGQLSIVPTLRTLLVRTQIARIVIAKENRGGGGGGGGKPSPPSLVLSKTRFRLVAWLKPRRVRDGLVPIERPQEEEERDDSSLSTKGRGGNENGRGGGGGSGAHVLEVEGWIRVEIPTNEEGRELNWWGVEDGDAISLEPIES